MKTAIQNLFSPATVFVAWFATLAALYLGRRWFVRPLMASMLSAALLAFLGLSLADPRFAAVATAPDNVAVLAMFGLLGFFTWLATAQAVENDRRISHGLPLRETEFARKVRTWPDLVYSELICMIVVMTLLYGLVALGSRPIGAAGQRRRHAQPLEGPLVFPRPARDSSSTPTPGWPASWSRR